MSISTTARVTVAPTRRQLLANVVARVSSQQLAALAEASAAAQATSMQSQLDALLSAADTITTDTGVREALAVASPGLLDRAQAALAHCTELRAAGDVDAALALAGGLDVDLRGGLGDAAGQLAQAERSEATSALQDALETIGFHTTVEQVLGGDGIWAERDHQIVAARIADGGVATLEIGGCSEGACGPLQYELEQAIAAQGGQLEVTAVDEHGDPRGGSMIRSAGSVATNAPELARALARQAAPAGRFARTATASTVQRQRIGGG